MRIKILLSIALAFVLGNGTSLLNAQLRVEYKETLTNGATYCPTDNQYKNWGSFRSKLDTTLLPLYSLTVKGDNNATAIAGRTCTDATTVKRIAAALKNGTNYSVSCGGYTWRVSTTCNTGCSVSGDDIELTVDGSACTCGNPGWSFRPCIGNSNWGGINTAGCGGPTQEMQAYFEYVGVKNNMGATQSTLNICDMTQDVKTTFFNQSNGDVDSFQYYTSVNGTVTGPITVKGKILKLKDTTITVLSGLALNRGANNTIKTWIHKVNNTLDSFRNNDTSSQTLFFYGTPKSPVATDKTVCGSQSVLLEATPDNVKDTIIWYGNKQRTDFVGIGSKVYTKYLSSGATYTFWAFPFADFSPNGKLETTFAAGNGQSGNMFDITVKGGGITIDSMFIHASNTGTELLEVYIRKGSYLDAGAASTSTMWTKVFSGNVNKLGPNQRTPVNVDIKLDGGTKYGMYVQFPNSTNMSYTNGNGSNQMYENSEIRLDLGYGVGTNWSGTFNPRVWNGGLKYGRAVCPGVPDSAIITVNPAPYGSRLDPGTPFQLAPKNGGNGLLAKPHVIALGDTLAYDLRTPTAYNSSDYGTTWKVRNVSARTLSGRTITSYTWTDPVGGSSSVAGRLAYTPTSTEIDSVVELQVVIEDIGTTFCDTVIKHYVYVAPLPEPDFTRNSKVCDGEVVEFTNASKILKGFIDYKWYFGTGDSSEATDPIYQFPTYGTYYVKLNAISSIYGYVRTKIDTLVVTQIPKVAFKVNNACEKQTHTFTNQTTVNAGALSYQWNFGDGPGVQSTLKDPSHKYAATGQYKVTLTATANGCAASLTKNAYLFPKPKAVFTYPKGANDKYCTNNNVNFSNSSTISSGNMGSSWYFGDGERGTVTNPTHGYKTAGDFNVMLISISEFGCADTAKDVVKVGGAPVVSFTNSQVCDQTPTQFTNTTPAVSGTTANTTWSFGDGNTSTANSPQHQYMTLGPKNVKLVVRLDNGCRDSVSKTLNVGTQAVTDFSVENTCSGKPVQFENKTTYSQGNIVYKWNFGPDSSSIADPVYTYNVMASTTYNVTLTATVDGGCVSSTTKPITVYELPNSSFSLTDDWTPGEGYRTVRVTAANNTYPFYRFKFSDGGSINTSTGLYQFPYEGDFTVTLCVRNQADCESCQTLSKAIRNPLGVTTQTAGDVRIYPNPSSGVVNVSASSELKQITVYNVLGDEVSVSSELQGKTGRIIFNNLSEGIYLVKVTTAAGSSTSRITINK